MGIGFIFIVANKSKAKGRNTKEALRDKPTKPLRSDDFPPLRRRGLYVLAANFRNPRSDLGHRIGDPVVD